MRTESSKDMRLRIYLRREAYVWIYRRNKPGLCFGWILSLRGNDNIVFKDDERHGAIVIPVSEIECCGAV
ncbi:MAG TPA: hypothetical protein VEK08_22805 [Planctomycetota bacterium]|nr:hypothetical protein [Planctomycetota bacterium]